MYKLVYMKATNFIGFRSGLGKKTVEIDLKEMTDLNMIIILGDNGTGKSTFASLIPPAHTPFGTNKSFIFDNKEGLLIREYMKNDGTSSIMTKCVYLPKKDGGHTTKAYIGKVDLDGTYIELNPDGNIASYYNIVEAYFKINPSLLQLTYYDDNIKSLIRMTRSERINAINKYIPANVRYNQAYNIINEKYKTARNIMKNTLQKLNTYRPEDKLTSLLINIEEYISSKSDKYEEVVKKIAVIDSKIETALAGKNINDLVDKSLAISDKIKEVRKKLSSLKNINKELDVDKLITVTEKKIFELELTINNSPLSKYREDLYSLEESLEKYEALNLYGDVNVDELKKLLKKIDKDISELNYTKNPKLYDKMSMTEIELLDQWMVTITEVYEAIIDLHEGSIADYYEDKSGFKEKEILKVKEDIIDKSSKIENRMNEIQNKLSYYKGFGDMKKKLSLRPPTCKIDNCVFISDALKWLEFEPEIESLKNEFENMVSDKTKLEKDLDTVEETLDFIQQIKKFEELLKSSASLLKKYCNLEADDIYKSITKGRLPEAFNYYELRNLMTVLSEKERYNTLVNSTRPEIVNKIQIMESKAENINFINNEINNLKDRINKLIDKISAETSIVSKMKDKLSEAKEQMEMLTSIKVDTTMYLELSLELNTLITEFESYDGVVSQVSELRSKVKDLKTERDILNNDLKNYFRERDTVKFELLQVKNLKLDLSVIESQFIIMDILKMISQPGKGVTKETIDIFMDEIQETANLLISKTFSGKFSLKKFIIDEDTFDMPFSFNGVLGLDLADASSAQRNIASNCISLATLSKIIEEYSIVIFDEPDKTLSPDNREEFIKILGEYTKFIGIEQSWIITHSPEYYEGYDAAYILFPGYKMSNLKDVQYIKM